MKFILTLLALLALVVTCGTNLGCSSKQLPPIMNPELNYERDMVVRVNGVTRQGSITMPLLPVNKVHVWAQGNLDVFLMKSCGGTFKKLKAWNVSTVVKSGLFGWGSKKIESKNEVEFDIAASDFADTGVCPLYLTGISKEDGRHSDAYINWQTDAYKLRGTLVCQMEKRDFEGVEACDTSTGSYTKVTFPEDVYFSPRAGCELPQKSGKAFEFRANSGTCNYEFEGKKSKKKGFYMVYGWDEPTIR